MKTEILETKIYYIQEILKYLNEIIQLKIQKEREEQLNENCLKVTVTYYW